MRDAMTTAELEVWGKAYVRSVDSGDDHGWAAFAADNAVLRP